MKCTPVWQVKHLLGNTLASLVSGFFFVSVEVDLETVGVDIFCGSQQKLVSWRKLTNEKVFKRIYTK